jgi:hypothetical protein
MVRALLMGFVCLLVADSGLAQRAKSENLAGNLQAYNPSEFRGGMKFCGSYFALLPPNQRGTKDGMAFRLLMFNTIPTDILTAWERVTLTLDETKTVPWASVELETGMFYTQLHVSAAALQEMSCLSKAKRA